MVNLILAAIPAFLGLLALEWLSFRLARDDHGLVGYEARDTRTSLAMGLGNVAVNLGWKAVVLGGYAALHALSPLRLDPGDWWTWVLLFLADDLSYYCAHRASHRVRLLWASHVVHHSSQHYNLSTALRQSWTPFGFALFWSWMPLVGFSPWMVLLAQSWNLLYQFWVHTERVGHLPRPLEAVLNAPSHHRVHHGANERYLDRNYGGVLIVWDRLFGTWEPEGERVRYGLTKNIATFNPLRVAFHEYGAIVRDLRAAGGWRERLRRLLGPPGWEPAPAEPRGRRAAAALAADEAGA